MNKLILSMEIRLIGESYMQNKIVSDLSNGHDILKDIFSKKIRVHGLLKRIKSI